MAVLVPSLIALLTFAVGLLLGALLTTLRAQRAGTEVVGEVTARAEEQAVLRDGLDRLHDRLGDVEQQRASWQGQLRQQVEEVRHSTDQLRRETGALSHALRKPQVRGQWGELHLRRAVELAGLVPHCDFAEQVSHTHDGAVLRPDLVVHLAGGRSVVVDAKVPLDAQLDAMACSDPEEAAGHLRRHARQVRTHVEGLAAKSYWRALPGSPEFVVMFLPAESFLSTALETDPELITWAAERDVVLASPTTLIALLRTVAHGWRTEQLAERTREIHELGLELHRRLGVMGGHLDRLARSLKGTVEAYNAAVGSLEGRVLVTARQFEDVGVAQEPLTSPRPVDLAPRPLTAAELLEVVAEQREELPAPQDGRRVDGESHRSAG